MTNCSKFKTNLFHLGQNIQYYTTIYCKTASVLLLKNTHDVQEVDFTMKIFAVRG